MSPPPSSPKPTDASKPVSLPSIHEMFPDHLMRKDAHGSSSERTRFERGFPYPDSPGVHHPQLRHRVSIPESQCGCRSPCSHQASTHTDAAPTHSHVHHRIQKSHLVEGGLTPPNPSEGTYGFSIHRSSPTSASSQQITSNIPANRSNPQYPMRESGTSTETDSVYVSSTSNNEDRDRRHARGTMPPRMSLSISDGSYPASSPRTRAAMGIDPHAAVISFPLSPPRPLHGASSKQRHYPLNLPSSSRSGALPYEQARPHRGNFQGSGGGANTIEEDDDGASPADDNDTSNGKKHVCPTCFKRFNRPSSLRIHVNTHTGATPFRCPWPNCGREFNVNSNMRRHYRNHTAPGVSRSQATNQPGSGNPQPADGRRKRRRVSASQLPSPLSANASSSIPISPPYPPGYGMYRPDQQYRQTPQQYDHQIYRPQVSQRDYPQQYPGAWGHSPAISHSSISDEDSTSGTDSEMEEDNYSASRSHPYSRADKEVYEPDASSLRSRTASLTQSLARVAVASTSRRSHPYALYSPGISPTSVRDTKEETDFRQGPDDAYDYSGRGHRSFTPGSSFHSSSPSPSTSPSPPPHPNIPSDQVSPVSSSSGYKYNASSPYMRSLADSRVSTTLRPAFGHSNERERGW